MKYRLLIYEPGSVTEVEVSSLKEAMRIAYSDIKRIRVGWKIEILPSDHR